MRLGRGEGEGSREEGRDIVSYIISYHIVLFNYVFLLCFDILHVSVKEGDLLLMMRERRFMTCPHVCSVYRVVVCKLNEMSSRFNQKGLESGLLKCMYIRNLFPCLLNTSVRLMGM